MRGSCLCGRVAFESQGTPTPIEYCHCSRCKKAFGGAFAATLYVPASSFRWSHGEELVSSYDAPIRQQPPAYRHVFCRLCGSPLPIVNRAARVVEIPAGVLDDDPGTRPLRHIFVELKAPWFELTDALPRYARHVPPSEHLAASLSGSS